MDLPGEEYDGAQGVAGLPAAEGTVDLRSVDLVAGTLYRYEETVALGADPARFREELPRWLDLGLRLVVEALRIKFEGVDLGPVEAKARAELLPELARAILAVRERAAAALVEIHPRAPGLALEEIASSEAFAALARELAALGIAEEDLKWDFEDVAERVTLRLAERFLAPLPEEHRAKVMEALFADEGFDDFFAQALQKLHPDEEARRKLQRELLAFAVSGVGAYAACGVADSFYLRFRVELPGAILRTNGDLAGGRAVEWRLDHNRLLLEAPVLFAYGFEPAEGFPAGGWTLAPLWEVEAALRDVASEDRPDLEAAVAKAVKEGWPEEAPLDDEPAYAFEALRKAIAGAKANGG